MQKTSKNEALAALTQALRKAGGVMMLDNPADIVREFIELCPDTGEAVPFAWYSERSYGITDGEYSKWGRELTFFEVKAEPGFRNIMPLFTHPVTPEGGALVPPREPSQTMMDMGLYHSSADSSWADIHTVWTSMWDVAFRDGDLAQPDLSASGGAQGLEWSRNRLYFKNKEIGSYHIWPGSVAITFMGGAGARQFEFVDEAKAALELEARTWLSPLSQATDTVAVSRERLEECFALEDTLRKEHVPDSLLREISSLRDRLRASMGGK